MSLKEIVLPETLAEAGLDTRRSVLLVADHLNQADFLELTTGNSGYISLGIAQQSGALRFFFADIVRHSQLRYVLEQETDNMDKFTYGQIFTGGRKGLVTRLFLETGMWNNEKQMKQVLVALFDHVNPDLLNPTIILDIPEGKYLYYKADRSIFKKVS